MQELTERLDALIGRGHWDEAERLLLTARDRTAAQGNGSMALSIESELMGFYRMWGRADGFETARQNAMSLLKSERIDRRSRGTILINAATGLVAFGRAAEALPLYEETEVLYKAVLGPDDLLFAALYNNMSTAFLSLGDISCAENSLRRVLKVFEKHPHHPDLATTWVNLAQLYAAADTTCERAHDALSRAREIFDDPEMIWDEYYAHTAQKCAGAFADLRREQDAEELRERAEIIYEGT